MSSWRTDRAGRPNSMESERSLGWLIKVGVGSPRPRVPITIETQHRFNARGKRADTLHKVRRDGEVV